MEQENHDSVVIPECFRWDTCGAASTRNAVDRQHL
jgi:hypothetical protein